MFSYFHFRYPQENIERGMPDDATTFLSSSLLSPRKQRLFSGLDTDQMLRPLSTVIEELPTLLINSEFLCELND
jgi:hypothetical protein